MQLATSNKLTRRDWLFIAVCAAVFAVSVVIIQRWFGDAFPEATIDFRYDRSTSTAIAERLLASQQASVASMKHTTVFESDDTAKIFLERSLGIDAARRSMERDVRLWFWRHRWFKPLQEEEFSVDVAPTGEIVSYARKIPEARAIASPDVAGARVAAENFLGAAGVRLDDLTLVAQSERRLPKRMQRIFTWDSKSIRPGGAPYRHIVAVDGTAITSYSQRVKVPDEWLRSYRELRSKNITAGRGDLIFQIITIIAAVAVFISRLRRGNLHLRFLLILGAVSVVLVLGVSLNQLPSIIAGYQTATSYAAFIANLIFGLIVQSLGTGMLLIVICGAGEVLYRERLPQHLAIPKLWTPRALASKRVFRSLILGYALVGFFIAYQVAFYLIAARFGAWSPLETPYDDMLNSAIPWVAVLFAGFFPALSEEFLSRAFSIPFFQRVLRSRLFAIVLAGFIWGFGHATYPQQPFYIRGVEVGLAGVLLGFLMDAYGLLPLLIWHYTVDAIYTALLLFRSGNTYYIFSAALASLVFAIPLVASIALYIRNKGFIDDDALLNATMPVAPPPEAVEEEIAQELPPAIPLTRGRALFAIAAIAVAAIAIAVAPTTTDDAIDYRITKEQAEEIAAAHLRALGQPRPEKTVAIPVAGFRSWESESQREDGGAAGGFDNIAAEHMVRSGLSIEKLTGVMRGDIHGATWMVRFFTPMQPEEWFVEVDPRTSRVVGYHKYQRETNRGPQLEQAAALAVARTAIARYGGDPVRFELKEALSYQKPNRRDWLFHFDERQPIVAGANRRATVRVAGAEVTQFHFTIKVPAAVYREAETQTLLNVVLSVLKIIGAIAILSLIVTGLVIATRRGGLPWRRAARWTAILAIIPIAGALADLDMQQFGYATSVQWDTFRVDAAFEFVRGVGLQLLLLFLALAGLQAALPYALDLLRRESRARFGRDAVAAALGAIALFFIFRVAFQHLERMFPKLASIATLDVPSAVGLPFPSLLIAGEAIFLAVVVSGAVALFALAAQSISSKPWVAPLVTTLAVFCLSVDAAATPAQAPLMLLRAAAMAALVWVLARWVLDGNPLAWPVAAFFASILQNVAALAPNDRADLQMHVVVLGVIVVAAIVWLMAPRNEVA